jgi:L-ribulose-5-phosphate 3-epimerase
MKKFKLGVILSSFKTDTNTALQYACDVGVKGIQINANNIFETDDYNPSRKKEFIKRIKNYDLDISAFGADLGNHGFSIAIENKTKIENLKKTIYLAKEMGTNIIVSHIGVIPEDNSHDRYKIMQEACWEAADYANSLDATFAIETGPETAIVLKDFLDSLGSKGIGVNLDPANLVMITGDIPAEAVFTLKDYVIYTHAKDGVRLLEKSPEELYRDIEKEIVLGMSFKEMQLGEGDVNFAEYLKALDDIGYDGYLTIEREVGESRRDDISKGVQYLKQIVNNI